MAVKHLRTTRMLCMPPCDKVASAVASAPPKEGIPTNAQQGTSWDCTCSLCLPRGGDQAAEEGCELFCLVVGMLSLQGRSQVGLCGERGWTEKDKIWLAVNSGRKNTVQQEQQVSGHRHLVWVVAKADSEETADQKVKCPHQPRAGKGDVPRSECRSWKLLCLLHF